VFRFQVGDTGIGIASEKLEEIFLPFQQVDKKSYSVEGTGLGLAISYKLVQMMGAELHVQSTIGEGSVFRFDLNLPIVEGVVASAAKQSRKVEDLRKHLRPVSRGSGKAKSRSQSQFYPSRKTISSYQGLFRKLFP